MDGHDVMQTVVSVTLFLMSRIITHAVEEMRGVVGIPTTPHYTLFDSNCTVIHRACSDPLSLLHSH